MYKRTKTFSMARAAMTLVLMMFTTMTVCAQTTSTITVGGTDYTLFTGFTATNGNGRSGFPYTDLVDGDLSTQWMATKSEINEPYDFAGGTDDPAFVEFHADAPIIPKGYVLTCEEEDDGWWKPVEWALKAKLNEGDEWTTIHSSNTTLGAGKTFEIACTNDADNQYRYFRFEVYEVGLTLIVGLDELQFYGSVAGYTPLTIKAATCMATGIKVDCYQRTSDGKYFTDNTGTTELAESDVIAPMIPHTGVHHEATDVNIEYWQCSMCSKYFSNENCTTEITEEDTKIYRTITIDGSISSLVSSNVSQALAGATVTLTVSHLIDASTLKVNNGAVELTDIGSNEYTFIVPTANVTVTASILSTYTVTLPDHMQIVNTTNEADGNGKYISGTVITFVPNLRYAATNVSDGTSTGTT